ncbi:MAG: hypothetical protein K0R59_2273 [Sphingobacterium sp.]|jgi:hypothetical protein|uniref:hypothetical protein n=1 Tax=unclassified Sphingobacterium TaxID=2609468 RepID=UPI0009860E8A|nr:hypothetical protein [Sphingobacterium sp. CZ-UAM]MDF2516977.1 hypothetical protein [Sphingobacterium sp.]OOG17783.1 hypothetical protein BWD42_10745 [Sphingobacterium sp. CZ-UAM]
MEVGIQNSSFQEPEDIKLSPAGLSFLASAAKWANFLAIICFIFIGLSAITMISLIFGASALSLGQGEYVSAGTISTFGILYLLMMAFACLPIYFLYNFGSKAKKAIENRDSIQLELCLEALKKHYKFIGIIVIITIGFNFMGLLIGIVLGIHDAFAAV